MSTHYFGRGLFGARPWRLAVTPIPEEGPPIGLAVLPLRRFAKGTWADVGLGFNVLGSSLVTCPLGEGEPVLFLDVKFSDPPAVSMRVRLQEDTG